MTLFICPGDTGRRKVLRTHTSPVQIRTMEASAADPDYCAWTHPRSDHDATIR